MLQQLHLEKEQEQAEARSKQLLVVDFQAAGEAAGAGLKVVELDIQKAE
jgi:hypothetical protein